MQHVVVASYFLIEEKLIPIEEFHQELPDINYVNGVIECTINGQEILGRQHWDLIDQLWCYLVTAVETVLNGERYESSFPDQPLLLSLEPCNSRNVRLTIGDNTYEIAKEAISEIIIQGAIPFFQKMLELAPSGAATWNDYLKRATKLGTAS